MFLFGREVSGAYESVHERVVVAAEYYALSWPELVNAAVTDMSGEYASAMEVQERESGGHAGALSAVAPCQVAVGDSEHAGEVVGAESFLSVERLHGFAYCRCHCGRCHLAFVETADAVAYHEGGAFGPWIVGVGIAGVFLVLALSYLVERFCRSEFEFHIVMLFLWGEFLTCRVRGGIWCAPG